MKNIYAFIGFIPMNYIYFCIVLLYINRFIGFFPMNE